AHGPPVLAGLFLLGTQYGALSALIPAATASTIPPHQYGRTYGIVFTGWGLAGLVSPLAMAWLASRAGNQLIFAVATAVALLMWANLAALTARSTSPR
ncbi:MAG: MFS transporter, partial [Candidatus Dormibacteraeota bacterium]|nr:MFS transporter [Candidatus Dormibacteraeota bacterium]